MEGPGRLLHLFHALLPGRHELSAARLAGMGPVRLRELSDSLDEHRSPRVSIAESRSYLYTLRPKVGITPRSPRDFCHVDATTG